MYGGRSSRAALQEPPLQSDDHVDMSVTPAPEDHLHVERPANVLPRNLLERISPSRAVLLELAPGALA